jgi:hypothetical protein
LANSERAVRAKQSFSAVPRRIELRPPL